MSQSPADSGRERSVLAEQSLVRAVKISVKRSLARRTSLARPAGER